MINYRLLRQLRKLNDLRLEEVAHYLGYESASSYHRLENGRLRPTVSQVRRLCELYDLAWEDLLGPAPKQPEPGASRDKS